MGQDRHRIYCSRGIISVFTCGFIEDGDHCSWQKLSVHIGGANKMLQGTSHDTILLEMY